MEIFQTSQIILERRYQYEFESPTIYSNVICLTNKRLMTYIDINGQFGVINLNNYNDEIEPRHLKDEELTDMATIPGKIDEIGNSLSDEIKNKMNSK